MATTAYRDLTPGDGRRGGVGERGRTFSWPLAAILGLFLINGALFIAVVGLLGSGARCVFGVCGEGERQCSRDSDCPSGLGCEYGLCETQTGVAASSGQREA